MQDYLKRTMASLPYFHAQKILTISNYNVFNSNFCGYLKLLPFLKSKNPEITRIGSFYKNLNFFSTDIDLQNGRLAKNTTTDAMDFNFNNWQSSQCLSASFFSHIHHAHKHYCNSLPKYVTCTSMIETLDLSGRILCCFSFHHFSLKASKV